MTNATTTTTTTTRTRSAKKQAPVSTTQEQVQSTCVVPQKALKAALSTVGHAISGKSMQPVLTNVLLAHDNGRLKISGTNLEIGLTCWTDAKIDEDFATTVPAKLLTDTVGYLPNEAITLHLNPHTLTMNLTCAKFQANFKGIAVEQYPQLPVVTGAPNAVFVSALLRDAIDQVAFAAATDISRPVLTGVLLRLKGTTATFAAADGSRIAMRKIRLSTPVEKPVEVIIPAQALIELRQVINTTVNEIEVRIADNGGNIVFRTPHMEFVSRLSEGKFPDFERIIPAKHTTRMVLDTRDFARAIKLASFFAAASANIITLTLAAGDEAGSGKLTLATNAAEIGDNNADLDGKLDGQATKFMLNAVFLEQAISAVSAPFIVLETQLGTAPVVFKPLDNDDHIQILMPMTYVPPAQPKAA